MTPLTRKENYLNEIVGWGETAPEKPLTPEEFFFAAILGEAVQTPEPLNRYQIYLAKIAGRNISVPKPLTRLELFLARAAGMEIETPTPITREEMFWADYALIVEKELSGIPPLTYKAKKAGTLKNYRIYGNTVNGGSVGDRTANLIQGSIKNANIGNKGKINPSNEFNLVYAPVVTGESYTISNNNGTNVYAFYNTVPSIETETSYDNNRQIFSTSTITFVSPTTGYIAVRLANTAQDIMINSGSTAVPYEPVGYRVPVTVEGKNLFDEVYPGMDVSSQATYRPLYVGDGSFTMSSNIPPFIGTMSDTANIFLLSGNVSTGASSINDGVYNGKTITKQSKDGYITIAYRIYFEYNPRNYKTMINSGSTPLPYEPYHAPVTTPIYLPEPIKMVGDEAEYIDYGEQKFHRISGADLDVTLPALPTLPGTNVLSVGTAVQPSKVYVKYKGERQ